MMSEAERERPPEWRPAIRTVTATRYVVPLREGGSLPAIVEADDLGTYVLKFSGAGQGAKVLVAELICGEIARALGLPMPEIVLVQVDPVLGRSEPDPEIQHLIQHSTGLNLALDYLPGSLGYDPLLSPRPDALLASAIVWFDALIMNVDRTVRNTNMLLWHRHLYLIDNGAALYFHHSRNDYVEHARSRFPQIRDHVLLALASELRQVDGELTPRLHPDVVKSIVDLIPDEWLIDDRMPSSVDESRAAYEQYFRRRLEDPHVWVEEAIDARTRLV